ncbi:MAG: VWA domain-containing protein [Planctomycetaceae bacterium]|jgi:Ca-activated chloride channel family protein
MNAFRFHEPLALLLLLPVLAVGWWSLRRDHRSAVTYSSVALLRNLPVTMAQRFRRLLPWLRITGTLMIVVAVARPQFGREEFRVRTEGIAIEMCIDRSGSMQAMDFPVEGERVSRLDAVKYVFRRFVAGEGEFGGRPDDIIGLVAFGGFADAKCPPTLDHGTLLEILETVEIPEPIYDRQGRIINERLLQEEQSTAIGDAIAVAVDRLKEVEAKSKVIVLLSDGENTAGVNTPSDAAEAAKAFGIRIYAIGVGSNGTAPFPSVDLFGRQVLRPQQVRLDEAALKELAKTTDGHYFNAQNTESLAEVYEEIDRLEKTETEGQIYTDYGEYFQTLLLPGIACVLLELILTATRFRSLP